MALNFPNYFSLTFRAMSWGICVFKLVLLVTLWKGGHCGREQQVLAPKYIVSGESVELPCTLPAINDLLKWKFQANGSNIVVDVAQYFPGGLTTIFGQFDLPPARSTLIGGFLTITNVAVPDEGQYWCEIVQPGEPTLLSDKYPIVVWVTPRTPTIIPEGNGTVLEYTKTSVARCSSSGGKPVSQLSWWNGSEPLPSSAVPVVSKNPFSDKLWDVTLDLVLEYPTRFDHKRNFTCLVEHPAYKGTPKSLNHSVKVLYHPVNARIWANLTTLFVYCEADGYKAPKYDWVIPGDLEYYDTPDLYMSDLYSLPGYEYFECKADNGVPPAAVARIMVDDLRWPNGKPIPMFAGLAWYIWAAIGGGLLLVIIIAIIALCCYCKKKKKNVGYNTKKTGVKAKYQPAMTSSTARHSQSSLLDSMRTPDGRESSLPPASDYNPSKASMARSYSLEHLVDEKYPGQARDSVTLIPLNHMQRGELYNDSSLRRRASCEEIDKVADHIEVLNKSWDNLARSREDLNRSREQLRVDLPPRYQSREELHDQQASHSRADEKSSYPYMDDATDPHHDRYNVGYQGNQNNYQHGGSGDNYDQRGYYDDQYTDQQQQQQQPYSDGNYQQQYGDRNRNASYGDSEFDDDNGNYGDRNYDSRGYQPSSMI